MLELHHGGLDGLGAALHVGLDQDGHLFLRAGGDAGEHLLQRAAGGGRTGGGLVAQLAGAELRDFAGTLFVFDDHEGLAGRGHAAQAEDFHGGRRAGDFHRAALVVEHRPHAAPLGAGDDDVALVEGAVLHEDGGDRAAAAIQPAFDHRTFGRAVRVGLQVEDFGLQQDGFLQLVEVHPFGGRDFGTSWVSPPMSSTTISWLSSSWRTRCGRGVWFVHLVDGDDDGRMGRLGVFDRLDGLRHYAVICGDHQHHDIGHRRAAGAHGREGLVARACR